MAALGEGEGREKRARADPAARLTVGERTKAECT